MNGMSSVCSALPVQLFVQRTKMVKAFNCEDDIRGFAFG